MHYRSVADLGDTIMQNLHKLPQNVDLVVGDPRSGLLAANLLCLALNVPMADVEGFLEGRILKTGITIKSKNISKPFENIRTVVVIDDCVHSGKSMERIRKMIEKNEKFKHIEFVFCAVYGIDHRAPYVDFVFDTVPVPCMFQWSLMHQEDLINCCVDIDGVLCMNPTREQDDDGPAYEKFLAEAIPMLKTTVTIGMLVTGRPEKYRRQTEAWLDKYGIKYNTLHMLGINDLEGCRKIGVHGQFKADVYAKSGALLFIESDYGQAQEIAEKSGKPALCIESQHIIYPSFNMAAVQRLPLRLRASTSLRFRLWLRRVLSEKSYQNIKGVVNAVKSLV